MLSNHQGGNADHHVQEVLNIFPTLQFGMDLNPKFTAGPTGVEYTMHLNAFDLLHIELVHGWLLEPDAQEYAIVGNLTYNQLVNVAIEGNEAAATLHNTTGSSELASVDHDALSTKATQGAIVKHFLDRSCHQLTQFGLTVLHEYLKDGQMVVFFRNNHFNTLTKHDGLLYLLVTDFGYANVPSVVWEKLDVIDGDTEFVNAMFKPSPSVGNSLDDASPGNMMGNNLQTQADYQLALQLSQEAGSVRPGTVPSPPIHGEMEAARLASVEEYNRAHPENPISTTSQTTNASSADPYFSALGQQINSLSGTMRQATESIQQAAASMFPQSPSSTTADTPVDAAKKSDEILSSQESQAPFRGTVVVGIPAQPPSQEEKDRLLALQLQRQEENERAQRLGNIANGRGQQQQLSPQQKTARPGAPPGRLVTAPSPSQRSGKDGNCVIS